MLNEEKMLNMLKVMYKIRYFEERTKKLFRQGLIHGAFHPYIGQEAVAVGTCATIERTDYIVSTHRGHGHFIAKGGELKYLMAELFGKETGCCKGRGGSMHVCDIGIGMLGGNGIVGGGIPIAVGAAFSIKYRKSNQVTICFFGEGAANQGTFHESLNMGSLWKLPVVFICENNFYAATTPVSDSLSVPNVADRAPAYGLLGKVVDGNDVLKVYDAVYEAVARARANKGPSLIECKTYRFEGHCMALSDHVYRTQDEVKEWMRKDPITRFEEKLLKDEIVTAKGLETMKLKIINEINKAESFAKGSQYPSTETLKQGLYGC